MVPKNRHPAFLRAGISGKIPNYVFSIAIEHLLSIPYYPQKKRESFGERPFPPEAAIHPYPPVLSPKQKTYFKI